MINFLKDIPVSKKFIQQNLWGWLIVYFFIISIHISLNGLRYNRVFYETAFMLVWFAIFFYLNFFLHFYLNGQSKWKILFSYLILFILFIGIESVFIYLDYVNRGKKTANISIIEFYAFRILITSLYFLIIWGISTAYWYKRKNKKKDIQNAELVLKNNILQSKLLQSELDFLRAQINPHFLQNCLNFLYSDTRKTNPDAAEAILLLSELMRYSVADNSATGGMAMLEDELNQVESIININQLRFKESLNIVFIKDGNVLNKRIVPMILLTLVENLIKYADLNDTHNPARIHCTVNEAENKVLFTTINKKAFAAATSSSGLGFKNIKERLTLIWQDSFTLTHDDANGFFTVNLVMPFINIKPVGTKN